MGHKGLWVSCFFRSESLDVCFSSKHMELTVPPPIGSPLFGSCPFCGKSICVHIEVNSTRVNLQENTDPGSQEDLSSFGWSKPEFRWTLTPAEPGGPPEETSTTAGELVASVVLILSQKTENVQKLRNEDQEEPCHQHESTNQVLHSLVLWTNRESILHPSDGDLHLYTENIYGFYFCPGSDSLKNLFYCCSFKERMSQTWETQMCNQGCQWAGTPRYSVQILLKIAL